MTLKSVAVRVALLAVGFGMTAGVLLFPFLGAIAMLIQEREYLVFLPKY